MNESHLSPDDPRLTAYALGELEGPERAAVEAALAANPALRAAVEDIRATATQLEVALAAEPMPVASAVVMPHAPQARLVRFPVAYYVIGGLAAACFAVLIVRYEPPAHMAKTKFGEGPGELKNYVEIRVAPVAEPEAKNESEAIQQSRPIPAMTVQIPPSPIAPVPDRNRIEIRGTPDAATLTKYDTNKDGRLEAGEVATLQADQRKAALAATQTAETGFVQLSPFEVTSDTQGYYSSNTMSGTRFNSKIEDMSASITVVTKEQLASSPSVQANDSFRRGGAPAGSWITGYAPPPRAIAISPGQPALNTESYGLRQDNEFIKVASEPLSTFSIDVDTAGYSNVRRFLQNGQLPPRDAVRIEELVNYFPYRYAPPANNTPFAATLEVSSTPWEPKHRLVRIGLKGREVSPAARPAANLVFLLDVSGSMNAPNRLPLVKESLRLLVGKLRDDDRVAIVIYAGATGLALPSTPVAKSSEILAALDELRPGGSTNGGMGIQLAYDIAKANFVTGGVNRVILCTDGDFNVGVTNQGELVRLIEEKAKSNVFLTVLGFGMGNLKDATLELLADKGNGNYGYIDSRREAEKLLVEQVGGTLVTIAKDVKIQVEFNPAQVSAYRLIGYENRLLKKEDFNNDKIDAGEIGAGHTVTALYEVIAAGADEPLPVVSVDELKYQVTADRPSFAKATEGRLEADGRRPAASLELLTVKIRYKEPTGDESKKLEFPLTDRGATFAAASGDFKFAAAAASFGLALRADQEPVKRSLLADALRWAEEGLSDDPGGYRAEFIGLVQRAQTLVR